MMKKMVMLIIMNNPDENAKIVKGCISVVLQGRDLKFWKRSKKNNILRKCNFLSRLAEVRKSWYYSKGRVEEQLAAASNCNLGKS